MRILQVHNFYQYPGGEDSVVDAEKQLLETKGHTVVQYLRHNDEIKKFNLFQKINFFLEALYSRRTLRELKKLINECKPDIAHIHNVFPLISPSVYFYLKKRNILIVQTIHNFRFLCPNGLFFIKGRVCEKCKNGNTLHCLLNKCYKDSLILSGFYAVLFGVHRKMKTFQKKIDIFIALNNFTKNKLVACGFSGHKIEIEDNFLFQKENPIRENYEKENYVIFIGRLSAEKGLLTLLKAFQKLDKIDLKIAGEGNQEDKLKKFVCESNISCVEFLGFVTGSHKWKLLQNARFSVIPSQCYEHFPRSVLESFSQGTPVIASRIGGLPELIEDGRNGLLFEPGDSDDLAQKIDYLYRNSDKVLEMSRYARKCVEERYSAERHYERLMAICKRAIRKNAKTF